MANSPLLGGDRAARRPKGTSTDVLGPSDTSDSGSDLTGAVGAVETDDLGFDGGSNDDIRRAPGAGADIGDADLDSDSDSGGTGERAEAGRDTLREDAPDIMPDHVFGVGSDEAMVPGEFDELASDADGPDLNAEDDEERGGTGASSRQRTPQRPAERPRATDQPGANAAGRSARQGSNPSTKKGGDDPVSERDKSIDA